MVHFYQDRGPNMYVYIVDFLANRHLAPSLAVCSVISMVLTHDLVLFTVLFSDER